MSSKGAAGKAAAETFAAFLELFRSDSGISRDKILAHAPTSGKRLWYATQKGYVKKYGINYSLTEKGRSVLTEERIWKLTIPKRRVWDGKWRVVLFDIPIDRRKRRDAFRIRLKEMGLVCYQNSVWVYPYPLDEIVNELSNFYKLTGCVSFMLAEKLTGEIKLRKHFKLSRR